MTKEQLEEFLTAVEEKVTKALEPVVSRIDAVEKSLNGEGEGDDAKPGIAKALEDVKTTVETIKSEGDQAAREAISKIADQLGTVAKATVTRKSIDEQEDAEGEVEKSKADPLGSALLKAIHNPGSKVKLG